MTDPLDTSAIDDVIAVASRCLHDSLSAAYLFGSAVSGGLRTSSDLDLLLIVQRPLRVDQRQALVSDWLASSGPPGSSRRPLEITVVTADALRPWRHPPQRELQFGEWQRSELEAGHIPPAQPDPDLTLLLAQVRQNSRLLFGRRAEELIAPIPLLDVRRAIRESLSEWTRGWEGDERNALLALSRMYLTTVTGEFRPKDAAATWVTKRISEPHRSIVTAAGEEYLSHTRFDWPSHRDEVSAALRALKIAVENAIGSNGAT